MRKAFLALAAAATAVAVVSGCGTAEERPKADEREAPVEGRYVDVDGDRLFLRCAGEGSPTVVLEAGAGLDSSDWQAVQPNVADFTRVCSYDRRGLGRSEEGPEAVGEGSVAGQLHELLETAGVEPPFVLVGHSMGGLYVRTYAKRYPGEAVGMVLVDSVSGAETSLGDIPLAVLAAADSSVGDQGHFTELSSRSVLVVAKKSGHFIERDQPGLVVEAIRQVVEAAKSDSELAPCEETFPELGGECVPPDGDG